MFFSHNFKKKKGCRSILAVAAAAALVWNASIPLVWAQERLQEQAPQEYRVKPKDTLWGIAKLFLKDPWRWPHIWHANPDIANPHLIYPGDTISLVTIDGETKLKLTRGAATDGVLSQEMPDGSIKLSPGINEEAIDTVIPALPLDIIQGFLVEHRLVDPKEFKESPYILAGAEKHILAGKGDQVFARGNFATVVPNYGIYQEGKVFKDPVTREFLGFMAEHVGQVSPIDMTGDVGKFEVNFTKKEVRMYNRLMPLDQEKFSAFYHPKSPNQKVSGQVIHGFGGVNNFSRYDVVALNLGTREMLQAGDILAVSRKGELIRDRLKKDKVFLPSERSGLLMVFKSFEKMSLALILEAKDIVSVGDKVENPE